MERVSSAVKTRLVAAGRRTISSSRAAVGALVAVSGGQVGADERLESRPTGGLGVEALALGAQLVGEHVRDEVLFRSEVPVEGAVGQTGVGHHGGHAGAIDAVLLEAPSRRFDDAFSRGLLVVLAVAHAQSLFSVT
jgi:hypothetical protein